MRLLRLRLDNGQRIHDDSWEKFREVTREEVEDISGANLRSLYEDEIVLDMESQVDANLCKYQLDKEGIAYKEYHTGSRGRHFHIIVQGLAAINRHERTIYRHIFINKKHFLEHVKKDCEKGEDMARYNTALELLSSYPNRNGDTAVKSDINWIAMENKPHVKTGKTKILIKEKEGVNKLDLDLLTKLRKIYIPPNQSNNNKRDNSDLQQLKGKYKVTEILRNYNIITSSKNDDRCACPFHSSVSGKCLHYNDAKGLWYCFNCQTGGTTLDLVINYRNCSVSEAIKRLETGEL